MSEVSGEFLEIVAGSPDEHELAALVAVGVAASAAAGTAAPARLSEWERRARTYALRRPQWRDAAAVGTWRWSGHP